MGLGLAGRRARGLILGTAHLAGAGAGGAAVGALLGTSGRATDSKVVDLVVVCSVCVVATYLAFRRPDRSVGLNRQVPRRWPRIMPAPVAYFLWGVLLGSGVATLIPYSSALVVGGACFVSGPATGALVGATFGIVRESPTLVSLLREMKPPELLEVLPRFRWRVQRINPFVAAIGGALVILTSF